MNRTVAAILVNADDIEHTDDGARLSELIREGEVLWRKLLIDDALPGGAASGVYALARASVVIQRALADGAGRDLSVVLRAYQDSFR
ncbi:MAG: hypothetical protein LBE05_04280 [Microbacterium sp.]|jgi:hypothetical protein|nr:hypothetical protein [Microbacterium sp.]